MKFKTNLVVGAVFVALLAFVYQYEIKGGEERRKEAEQSKKILDFNASEVTRLVILNNADRIEIGRKEDDWYMLAPVRDEADSDAVDRYLRNLNEAEREKTVVDSAEALGPGVAGEYGLEAPRLGIFIETKEGPLDTLYFGADAPTDRFTYVKKSGANSKIDVVRAWRYDNLEKKPFDLRNRKITNFSQSDITAVRISSVDSAPLVLASVSGSWVLRSPVTVSADSDTMDALLRNIQNAEIFEFVDEDSEFEDLEQYGLAEGQFLSLTLVSKEINSEDNLFMGSEDQIDRLYIGSRAEDGRYFARNPERNPVFLVDSTLVQQLNLSTYDVRDKTPVQFSRDQVTNVQIKRDGTTSFATSKDTAGVWTIVKPTKEPAKSWKINSLLTDLLDLKTQRFTAPRSGKPVLDIHLNGKNDLIADLKFFVEDAGIFLELTGTSEAYQIDADSFSDIDLEIDEVRQEATSVDTMSTR